MTPEMTTNFQSFFSKLMHSKDTGEGINLTGDEVEAYFQFAASTMKPQRINRDFDEFPFAEGNDAPTPPPVNFANLSPLVFTEPAPIYHEFQQLKAFHNDSFYQLHDDVNNFMKTCKKYIFGVTSIEKVPELGFVMSVIYMDKEPFEPEENPQFPAV